MNIDPKIKENKMPLFCFQTDEAKKFINEKGYFSSDSSFFADLSRCLYGILDFIDSDSKPYRCYENQRYYNFFLPEIYVSENKEKKFRPYTIAEFQRVFTIGRPIRYRIKNQPDTEKLLIFNGYERNNNKVYIYFGCISYTLEQLFDDFEWQEYYPDAYKPFGMEDGD